MFGDDWEPDERALIGRLLGGVELFLNVGAHYGFYLCVSQKRQLPAIALEPIAANIGMIAKNLSANGWGRDVTVLPVAAGEERGFARIRGGGSGATLSPDITSAPASQVQTVPVVRLDDVVQMRGRRMLVLMDVEGFELSALKGAAGLLEASPNPVWIVEILARFGGRGPVRPGYLDTFRLMDRSGYAIFHIDGGPQRLDLSALETVAAQDADALPEGNFLFVGKDDARMLALAAG
jgi:FkbM family methyltransferase